MSFRDDGGERKKGRRSRNVFFLFTDLSQFATWPFISLRPGLWSGDDSRLVLSTSRPTNQKDLTLVLSCYPSSSSPLLYFSVLCSLISPFSTYGRIRRIR